MCSMRRAWCPFVKDRANAFADFTPTTPLSDMGVPREGSVQEALARPGVYAADLACANEETSWTCLDPRVSGDVFREPAGGIVDHYLTSQAKFLTLILTLTLTLTHSKVRVRTRQWWTHSSSHELSTTCGDP